MPGVTLFVPLLAAAAVTLGCGASVKRVISVRGFAPEEISMSAEEGAMVDQMVADEPRGDYAAKCDYWEEKVSEIPPSKPGAVEYARKKGGGVCQRAGK